MAEYVSKCLNNFDVHLIAAQYSGDGFPGVPTVCFAQLLFLPLYSWSVPRIIIAQIGEVAMLLVHSSLWFHRVVGVGWDR